MAVSGKKSIGFVGFGRMGSALAKGAVASRALRPSDVWVRDTDTRAAREARSSGFRHERSLQTLVGRCSVVFLCVKPSSMPGLLREIVSSHAHATLQRKCFVSIAAGVSLIGLQKTLGKGVPVIRVMPNTPALIQAGMSGISRGGSVRRDQAKLVESIFTAVGKTANVAERLMHVVTAVSGSGPAYVFYLAEALTDAAVSLGVQRSLAERMVRQTVAGAGLMLARQNETAAELRRQVTSPGGTTEAAIQEFEKRRLKKTIRGAVEKAVGRSKNLSRII